MLAYSAADPLCQVLNIVQDLLQRRRNRLSKMQAQNVHDVVDQLLGKVHNIVKKFKVGVLFVCFNPFTVICS
jgi:hypothetical protein